MKIKQFCFFAVASVFAPLSFPQSLTKVVENSEASFYVRSDSLRKKGSTVEFWQITDFKQPKQNKKGDFYLSMEQRLVVDCVNSTQTLNYVKVFSSAMASGNLVASGSLSQKNQIPNGSSLEVIKAFVCR
jgi:hypothetical protein